MSASNLLVSIPQAVGTVATILDFSKSMISTFSIVSIPQAVGTVATFKSDNVEPIFKGFNTASGRYCCNLIMTHADILELLLVSIPQAVGTVAT